MYFLLNCVAHTQAAGYLHKHRAGSAIAGLLVIIEEHILDSGH